MVVRCKLMILSALLGLATWAALPGSGNEAQAPAQAAAKQRAIFDLLDTEVDLQFLRAEKISLKDVLEALASKVLEKYKAELAILVDVSAFKEANPDTQDVFETTIELSRAPRFLTVAETLRFCVKQIPSNNGHFCVQNNIVYITTIDAARAEAKLCESVVVMYANEKLADVCEDLARRTGVTIAISDRARDKAKQTITTTFRGDISLGGALRVLTETADLKFLLLDGAVLVTTPTHADQLRDEARRLNRGVDPDWPTFELRNRRQTQAVQ
jgi:hypothetical protein